MQSRHGRVQHEQRLGRHGDWAMGDSSLSASELRQRYHRGGSAKDDELTAKQLRARHAIPSNSAEFSTSTAEGGKGGPSPAVIGVVLLVLVVLVVGYFVTRK